LTWKWQSKFIVERSSLCTRLPRVPTGQGKLENVRICVVRESWGNGREKYYFGKVGENGLGSCRQQITVIFCISKY